MQNYCYQSPVIVHKQDPSKYNAFVAYMGGQYYQKTWDLSKYRYHRWGFQEQIFRQNIQKLLIQKLILDYNHTPLILPQISAIIYQNLQILCLAGNQIESLESLTKINAVELEQLHLSKNNIYTIRSLKKSNFPKLREIDMKGNCIVEFGNIEEVKATNLLSIQLEQYCRNEPIQCQDLLSLSKIESDRLEWLIIANSSRISRSRYLVFKRRWTKMSTTNFITNQRRLFRNQPPRPLYQQ